MVRDKTGKYKEEKVAELAVKYTGEEHGPKDYQIELDEVLLPDGTDITDITVNTRQLGSLYDLICEAAEKDMESQLFEIAYAKAGYPEPEYYPRR